LRKNVSRSRTLAYLAAASLVAGCASTPAPVLQPNDNLVLQNVPPIPLALVTKVEPYTEFRGHSFLDWHPTRREMLVGHRPAGGNTTQLFRVTAPMAEPEQLTDLPDPVGEAFYEPRDGRYVVFAQSSGGNEATQLYRLDLGQPRTVTLLTPPDERHDLLAWLHGSSTAVMSSVPLDRTAQGGTRAAPGTTLWLLDPLAPAQRRRLAELPGTGWFGGAASPDDKQFAITRYVSATESEVWLIDVAGGAARQLIPAPGAAERASHQVAEFEPDGRALLITSDRAGEFRELMRYDLATRQLTRVTAHIPWDVAGSSLSEQGRFIAVQANVDGRDELRLFDGRTLTELPAPRLPAGSVASVWFHPSGSELAFSVDGAQGPSQIHTLDVASGRSQAWTRAYAPPSLDPSRFTEQQIVRWTSFDGRSISGLINRPPAARFPGKRPVLVSIHGGPEAQARMGFMARQNYLIDELGIAIIQPNVRGSSGYGKTFVSLDNGALREDSVKDIGALFDWIAQQPDLDASRVMVSGGSYGGYMSLAVAAHYAERIAGAIDVVGISHFVTFLQNTESYRRDLRRVEYGDERDPAMRALLDRMSPLTQASRITQPLLVVQGKNDPRVPYTEAEQIVAKARANGTPVWYLRAENEGHGFARKENADFYFYTTLRFMQDTLLR